MKSLTVLEDTRRQKKGIWHRVIKKKKVVTQEFIYVILCKNRKQEKCGIEQKDTGKDEKEVMSTVGQTHDNYRYYTHTKHTHLCRDTATAQAKTK